MSFRLGNVAWSWWTRSRAIRCGDYTYVGSIDDSATIRLDVVAPDLSTHRIRLVTGWERDDHNNPAIVAVTGKPLIVFYGKHSADFNTRWVKNPAHADQQPQSFGAEQSMHWGTGNTTSYIVALPVAASDEIHLFTRNQARYWAYARSDNWATDFTATTPVHAFDAGASLFFYTTFRQLDVDPTKARLIASYNPQEVPGTIRYAELDLTTGAITKTDGTVLGNLRTGVGLPVAITALELVRTCPASIGSWPYDVSGGAEPELTWLEFNPSGDVASQEASANYYWARRSAGSWTVEQVVAAGPLFGLMPPGDQGYFSGAQLDGDGRVLLGRQVGATWQLERWTRQGTSDWSATALASDDTYPLVRVWPVEGGGPLSALYSRITHWGDTYTDYGGELIGVAA